MKLNTFLKSTLKSTLVAVLCVGLGTSTYTAVAQSIIGGGGSGSGTVNSGVAPGVAYYAANGTAVSDGTVAAVKAGTLALGGATIGSNALAVTGTASISSTATLGGLSVTGNGSNFQTNGGASFAAAKMTGVIYASGTGTTNFPHFFIEPTGTTAATTWSTAGTGLGMNLASGFTGNFLDFRTAGGATTFQVSGAGTAYASTRFQAPLMTRTGTVTAPSWTTSGIGLTSISNTFTDSSSTGTVAAQYVNAFKAPTIAASSATTFTNSYNTYFENPVAGTNVTQTSAWALGADSLKVNGTINGAAGTFSGTLSTTGAIIAGATQQIYWSTRSTLQAPSDGALQVGDNALTNSFTVTAGASNLATFNGAIASGAGITANNSIQGVSNSSQFTLGSASDVRLTRAAAATWQFGAADVDTAPVAQTLRSQGALTGGTNNVAGANWTQIVSPGKGTGVGGSWFLQTAPAGSSGNTSNTPVTAISATGAGVVSLISNITGGSTSTLSLDRNAAPLSFTTTTTGISGIANFTTAGMTASSGQQSYFGITPVVNQSGTAGYTALLVNPSESATGSGTKLLQDWQVGGSSKASIDRTGALTLSSLSASSAVCTDGSKVLTTSGCSAGGNTTLTQGTFTPTVVGNGTAGTTTYVTQTGRYRKFTTGSVTQWNIDIYVRGTLDGAATGNVVIGGLPFTVNASSISSCSVGEAQSITFGAGYTQLGVEVVPSSTTLILNVIGTATTFANVPVANWGSNAFVKISCAIDE